MNIFVVIPFYNEEKWLERNIQSFLKQTDKDFTLVYVDNLSTDKSRDILSKYSNIHIITEGQKGTGSAADTGFRYAIANGAEYILRTDADCVVPENWIQKYRENFKKGYLFVGGIQKTLDDEYYRFWHNTYCAIAGIITTYGNNIIFRDESFKYSYKFFIGANLGIEAQTYMQVGGFPRKSINEEHDDFTLYENVRKHLNKDKVLKDYSLIIYTSMRRMTVYGFIKYHLYYSRKYIPKKVDIR